MSQLSDNMKPAMNESIIKKNSFMVGAIVLAVIIIDQIVKIWVKTHFYIGEDLALTSWWHLKFIENNGMAFGMELFSKLLLTFGRIIAVVLMILFVVRIISYSNIRQGFLVAMALVIAGAAGNIFDCVFYGLIFDDPMPPMVAQLFPESGGYGEIFQGRVVDMMYFPFFNFTWPEWVPIAGGSEFEFFQYIFNIADASICVGVALIILFYSKDASLSLSLISKKRNNDDKLK